MDAGAFVHVCRKRPILERRQKAEFFAKKRLIDKTTDSHPMPDGGDAHTAIDRFAERLYRIVMIGKCRLFCLFVLEAILGQFTVADHGHGLKFVEERLFDFLSLYESVTIFLYQCVRWRSWGIRRSPQESLHRAFILQPKMLRLACNHRAIAKNIVYEQFAVGSLAAL